ncbi:universal stress protein [Pseudooctadecabacter jejudonensis]|uniref:Universal stress protein G n=1 Tax=Pseudooctadecabacter jejudonensis TaxID=1391910 RepID=A0A1Y5SUB1_9RHOB|nr:universal stress protein [Pseudooctadecabacter jejudonensis]SLN48605.1 Universal stress protein G [Pseudooctadecabacter jejudonensis]
MYNHILIPVDLGAQTDYAQAATVARALLAPKGRLTLLHVIEPIPIYAQSYIVPDFETSTRDAARTAMNDLAQSLGVQNTAIVIGSAGRSIVTWAQENDADCIVIASHTPGLSNIVMGSTATWIVKHSPTALHVLR